MPNGYTAKIYEDQPVTFREFILDCARGFGFAAMQRDDPFNAPLITRYEPSTKYYDDGIIKAKAELEHYATMTIEQAELEAKEEYEKAMIRWRERTIEMLALYGRYESMRHKVLSWQVPNELIEMKSTILSWLSESLRHDCYNLPEPKLLDGPSWLKEKRERAERSLGYCIKNRDEEIERTEERNNLLAMLIESLEPPMPPIVKEILI